MTMELNISSSPPKSMSKEEKILKLLQKAKNKEGNAPGKPAFRRSFDSSDKPKNDTFHEYSDNQEFTRPRKSYDFHKQSNDRFNRPNKINNFQEEYGESHQKPRKFNNFQDDADRLFTKGKKFNSFNGQSNENSKSNDTFTRPNKKINFQEEYDESFKTTKKFNNFQDKSDRSFTNSKKINDIYGQSSEKLNKPTKGNWFKKDSDKKFGDEPSQGFTKSKQKKGSHDKFGNSDFKKSKKTNNFNESNDEEFNQNEADYLNDNINDDIGQSVQINIETVDVSKNVNKNVKNQEKEEVVGKKDKKKKVSSLFHQNLDVTLPSLEGDFEPTTETLFSERKFKDVSNIHPYIVSNLEQYFGITTMTTVQQLTLPPLLAGKDALVRSQTGSGKTLAYAVPLLHTLQNIKPKISRMDGVRALIVLPTRELALQTYECFLKLCRAFARIVPGILVGGEKRKSEKARLRKGINILIGTPGRLLDHAKHTGSLSFAQVSWLVIDEGDVLLDMGFERDVRSILEIMEAQCTVKRRQTVLLSATLTPGVEGLGGLALNGPERIDSADKPIDETFTVPDSLEHSFIVAAPKLRLVTLSAFLIKTCQVEGSNKVLIFVATQDMVDYFTELLPRVMDPNVEFFKLHGNMSQSDRTEVFKSFRAAQSGVLLSTDVASRGLDLPSVDWIVQYNAPVTPADYVHRVGRTARLGSKGNGLLFLCPSETQFLQWLAEKKIRLKEIEYDYFFGSLQHIESRRFGGGVEGNVTALQHTFEDAVSEQSGLHDLACKAYTSWARSYASYPKEARNVFNFKDLHLGHHAKSFALRDPPSKIGGIGRPKFLTEDKKKGKGKAGNGGGKSGVGKPRKPTNLGFESSESRTRRLIMSEFESGLPPVKKMKT